MKRRGWGWWSGKRGEPNFKGLDDTPDVGSFDSAQIDAAFQPLSFEVALNQDGAFSYPTSSAPADAAQVDAVATYAATSNAFQASAAAYAASSNAFQGKWTLSSSFFPNIISWTFWKYDFNF